MNDDNVEVNSDATSDITLIKPFHCDLEILLVLSKREITSRVSIVHSLSIR
jgi:hypothetical protein